MLSALLLVFVSLLVGIDQATKLWAAANLKDNSAIDVISGVFELQYTENRGVAFHLVPESMNHHISNIHHGYRQ